MVSPAPEVLRFNNVGFAIHHLIDDCPPTTVVRELLKNAEEAAMLAVPAGRIEWFIEDVNGVRKLGLFNEGPGMSAERLSSLMDLASTGKTLGTDANYGQGAKVSGLKVSPAGMVYRSCKDGHVSQLVLAAESQRGHEFPVYIKRRQRVSDEEGETWLTVVDVTRAYEDRADRHLDKEWTEVVLIGSSESDDTVAGLIPGITVNNWLMRFINQRFYRFAPSIEVRNAKIDRDKAKVASALLLARNV